MLHVPVDDGYEVWQGVGVCGVCGEVGGVGEIGGGAGGQGHGGQSQGGGAGVPVINAKEREMGRRKERI